MENEIGQKVVEGLQKVEGAVVAPWVGSVCQVGST